MPDNIKIVLSRAMIRRSNSATLMDSPAKFGSTSTPPSGSMMPEPPQMSKVAGWFPWMASYAPGQSPPHSVPFGRLHSQLKTLLRMTVNTVRSHQRSDKIRRAIPGRGQVSVHA
jgi:hypothetical protein